jgi:hypothetical protein
MLIWLLLMNFIAVRTIGPGCEQNSVAVMWCRSWTR